MDQRHNKTRQSLSLHDYHLPKKMKSCCKEAFENEKQEVQKKQHFLWRLQAKWQVNSIVQVIFILLVFAIGGSCCAYVGRKLMLLTGLERHSPAYWCMYIPLITLLWPLFVLAISIPFGQFSFFKNYLVRLGRRIGRRKA